MMSLRLPSTGNPKFPFPPPDFDPLTASSADLDKYRLPRPPDAESQPDLLRAWLRLFERPLTFSPPTQGDRDLFPPRPEIRPTFQNLSRFQNSSNWCGASIVPNGGQQFVIIFGEWMVPK